MTSSFRLFDLPDVDMLGTAICSSACRRNVIGKIFLDVPRLATSVDATAFYQPPRCARARTHTQPSTHTHPLWAVSCGAPLCDGVTAAFTERNVIDMPPGQVD